jgi:mono/diheme cytochrome c family protein
MEVPSLDPGEMADLVGYLYFFQFIDPPGDARRGRAVYAEKRCGTCHGSAEAGALVAPPLGVVVETLRTPLEIITQMWNHAGRMEERMTEVNVAWPVLKGGEMADLIAFLLRDRGGASQPAGPRASAPQRKRGEPAR